MALCHLVTSFPQVRLEVKDPDTLPGVFLSVHVTPLIFKWKGEKREIKRQFFKGGDSVHATVISFFRGKLGLPLP